MTNNFTQELFFPENFNKSAFDKNLKIAGDAAAEIKLQYADKSMPHWQTPYLHDLRDIEMYGSMLRQAMDVLILGMGGSSLGGKAIYGLFDCGLGSAANAPRLHFLDSIDPDTFSFLIQKYDPKTTAMLAISKSGNTAETLCQFLIVHDWMKSGGSAMPIVCLTEPGTNALRDIAQKLNLPAIDHDPNLGGRYSVLSAVGLLPAFVAGADIISLLKGGREAMEQLLEAKSPSEIYPAMGAAFAVTLFQEHKVNINVMMPYADRLRAFTGWHRQLWAESLGKNGLGATPTEAIGPADQHSQLQLYLDGPRDKLLTFLTLAQKGRGAAISKGTGDARLSYLYGRQMGDLMDAEQRATIETLKKRKLPIRVLNLPKLDEENLGALFMHFMLETAIAAKILGVNAFDQPAVEESKQLARAYMQEAKAA